MNDKPNFDYAAALACPNAHANAVVQSGITLSEYCYGLAKQAGWWIDTETGEDVRTWPKKFLNLWIGSKLMLVVSEVAEAMEGHRKDLMDEHLPHRKSIEVEGADAVIRLFDLFGGLGYDLGGALADKLAYNASRADHKIENRLKGDGKKV